MANELPDQISVNLDVPELRDSIGDRGRQEEPGGTGYQPQPGVYDAVVVACNARTKTNDGRDKKNIEWIFGVVAGPNTTASDPKAVGARLWKYSTFENQALWVLDMILFATGELKVGAHETAGKIKFSRKAQLTKPVRLTVDAGTSQDGSQYRAQLRGVFKPGSGAMAAPQQAAATDDDPFGGGGNQGQPAQASAQVDDEPPF